MIEATACLLALATMWIMLLLTREAWPEAPLWMQVSLAVIASFGMMGLGIYLALVL